MPQGHFRIGRAIGLAIVVSGVSAAIGGSLTLAQDETVVQPVVTPEPTLEALRATVRATVETDRADHEDPFTLEMEGEPVTLFAGDVSTDDDAAADRYRIALLPDRGFRLLDIVCAPAGGERLPAEITFENQSIAFAPGIGTDITCTFTLEAVSKAGSSISAPRAGRWRAVGAAARIDCGGLRTTLPRTTDNGRIQVKDGGRRIIATGLAEGRRTRIILDADPEKSGRWSGKLRVREQGQNITLDYTVDLISPTEVKGKMIGKFDVDGRSCTLSRDFTLSRRGK